MQNATLHIKVKPEFAKGLKTLSAKKRQSVGELIRQAVISCYQTDLMGLSQIQRQALEAYRGGYASIGKLAEVMGMNLLDMRKWLAEQDIPQNNSFAEDDTGNA